MSLLGYWAEVFVWMVFFGMFVCILTAGTAAYWTAGLVVGTLRWIARGLAALAGGRSA